MLIQVKCLVQIRNGNSTVLNKCNSIIPKGILFYTLDDGVFKIGDGSTTYQELKTLFTYNDLVRNQNNYTQAPVEIPNNQEGHLVVIGSESNVPKYTISDYTLQQLLSNLANATSVVTSQTNEINNVYNHANCLDISLTTSNNGDIVVVSGNAYKSSGVSFNSLQQMINDHVGNKLTSHIETVKFFSDVNKIIEINKHHLNDNSTYFIEINGFNSDTDDIKYNITSKNANVTITQINSSSLFKIQLNNVSSNKRRSTSVVFNCSISDETRNNTVAKSIISSVNFNPDIKMIYINGTNNDYLNGFVHDISNNIFAYGITYSSSDSLYYPVLIKFDGNLNVLATKKLAIAVSNIEKPLGSCNLIDVDKFGNVYFSFPIYDNTNNTLYFSGFSFFKLDNNLNIVIQKQSTIQSLVPNSSSTFRYVSLHNSNSMSLNIESCTTTTDSFVSLVCNLRVENDNDLWHDISYPIVTFGIDIVSNVAQITPNFLYSKTQIAPSSFDNCNFNRLSHYKTNNTLMYNPLLYLDINVKARNINKAYLFNSEINYVYKTSDHLNVFTLSTDRLNIFRFSNTLQEEVKYSWNLGNNSIIKIINVFSHDNNIYIISNCMDEQAKIYGFVIRLNSDYDIDLVYKIKTTQNSNLHISNFELMSGTFIGTGYVNIDYEINAFIFKQNIIQLEETHNSITIPNITFEIEDIDNFMKITTEWITVTSITDLFFQDITALNFIEGDKLSLTKSIYNNTSKHDGNNNDVNITDITNLEPVTSLSLLDDNCTIKTLYSYRHADQTYGSITFFKLININSNIYALGVITGNNISYHTGKLVVAHLDVNFNILTVKNFDYRITIAPEDNFTQSVLRISLPESQNTLYIPSELGSVVDIFNRYIALFTDSTSIYLCFGSIQGTQSWLTFNITKFDLSLNILDSCFYTSNIQNRINNTYKERINFRLIQNSSKILIYINLPFTDPSIVIKDYTSDAYNLNSANIQYLAVVPTNDLSTISDSKLIYHGFPSTDSSDNKLSNNSLSILSDQSIITPYFKLSSDLQSFTHTSNISNNYHRIIYNTIFNKIIGIIVNTSSCQIDLIDPSTLLKTKSRVFTFENKQFNASSDIDAFVRFTFDVSGNIFVLIQDIDSCIVLGINSSLDPLISKTITSSFNSTKVAITDVICISKTLYCTGITFNNSLNSTQSKYWESFLLAIDTQNSTFTLDTSITTIGIGDLLYSISDLTITDYFTSNRNKYNIINTDSMLFNCRHKYYDKLTLNSIHSMIVFNTINTINTFVTNSLTSITELF